MGWGAMSCAGGSMPELIKKLVDCNRNDVGGVTCRGDTIGMTKMSQPNGYFTAMRHNGRSTVRVLARLHSRV